MTTPPTQSRLRTAIVHDYFLDPGGSEQVVEVLASHWPDAPIYTLLYDEVKWSAKFPRGRMRPSFLQRIPGSLENHRLLLPLFDRAFRSFDLRSFDLIVSSSSGFAKSVRRAPGGWHVCYCHTPVRYLYGDTAGYVRDLPFPWLARSAVNALVPLLRSFDQRGARGVDTFIANSRATAQAISSAYGRSARTIYPPVRTDLFSASPKRGNYFLTLSRLMPYKRIDLVIQTFNLLRLPLKVVGVGIDSARLHKLAGPTIQFLGRVDDRERSQLVSEARALINPQEEDFGISMVEALAAGTPVIAFKAGGALDILEEGTTGTLFSEQSPAGLCEALATFEAQRFNPAVLVRRAQDFSVDRFVRSIETVVAESSNPRASHGDVGASAS